MSGNQNIRDIDTLIALFEISDWNEFHLATAEFELFISSDPDAIVPGKVEPVQMQEPATAPMHDLWGADVRPDNWIAIKPPHLGTFYHSGEPGNEPYVSVGTRVDPTTEVCALKVLKQFKPLQAGVRGTIREICIPDATLVEHGQELFWVEPD